MNHFISKPLAAAVLGIHCLNLFTGTVFHHLLLRVTEEKLHLEIGPHRYTTIKGDIKIYISDIYYMQ